MCPRGFSVFPDNNWRLVGLNEWIRVNLYEETISSSITETVNIVRLPMRDQY